MISRALSYYFMILSIISSFPVVNTLQLPRKVMAQTSPSEGAKVLVDDVIQDLKSNDTQKAEVHLSILNQQLPTFVNSSMNIHKKWNSPRRGSCISWSTFVYHPQGTKYACSPYRMRWNCQHEGFRSTWEYWFIELADESSTIAIFSYSIYVKMKMVIN
jgi:hypothetical protein